MDNKARYEKALRAARRCKPDKGDGRMLNAFGYGIIHGTMSMDSPNLQYAQPLPHLLAAIALAQIHDPMTWTKTELDEVLINGNNLITETLNYSQCPIDLQNIQLGDLNSEFSLRDHLVRYSVEETEARGRPIIQPEYYFDLLMGLKTFFMSHDYGILIADELKFAIWSRHNPCKSKKMYYIYVPYPCGSTGRLKCGGVSALLTVPTLTLLYQYIKRIIQNLCGGYAIHAINMSISKLDDTEDSWSPELPQYARHFDALFQPVGTSSMIEPAPQSPEQYEQYPVSRMPRLTAETGQMFSEFYPLQRSYTEACQVTPPTSPISRIPTRQTRLTAQPGQMFSQFYPAQSPDQLKEMESAVCPRPNSRIPVSTSRQRTTHLTTQPGQMITQCYPMEQSVLVGQMEPGVCPRSPISRIPRQKKSRLTAQPGQMFSQFYPAQSPPQVSQMESEECPRSPVSRISESPPGQNVPHLERHPGLGMFTEFIPYSPYCQLPQDIQMSPEAYSATPVSRPIARKPQSGFLQQKAPMFPNFYPYEESYNEASRVSPGMYQSDTAGCPQQLQTPIAEPYSQSRMDYSQFNVMAPTCPIEETPVFQRDVPQARRLFGKYCNLGKETTPMFQDFINLPPSPQNYSPAQSATSQQCPLNFSGLPSPRSNEQSCSITAYDSPYDAEPSQVYHEQVTYQSPYHCPYQSYAEQQNLFRNKYRCLGQTPTAMFPEFIDLPPVCPY